MSHGVSPAKWRQPGLMASASLMTYAILNRSDGVRAGTSSGWLHIVRLAPRRQGWHVAGMALRRQVGLAPLAGEQLMK